MIYLVDVVWCNHLTRTRNDIFGRCGVVESLPFHTNLVFHTELVF